MVDVGRDVNIVASAKALRSEMPSDHAKGRC